MQSDDEEVRQSEYDIDPTNRRGSRREDRLESADGGASWNAEVTQSVPRAELNQGGGTNINTDYGTTPLDHEAEWRQPTERRSCSASARPDSVTGKSVRAGGVFKKDVSGGRR